VDSQVFAGGKVALGQIRNNDIKVCQRHLRRSLTGCLLSPFSGVQLPHESFALPIPPFETTTIKKASTMVEYYHVANAAIVLGKLKFVAHE
jgi:hypothetical protein